MDSFDPEESAGTLINLVIAGCYLAVFGGFVGIAAAVGYKFYKLVVSL